MLDLSSKHFFSTKDFSWTQKFHKDFNWTQNLTKDFRSTQNQGWNLTNVRKKEYSPAVVFSMTLSFFNDPFNDNEFFITNYSQAKSCQGPPVVLSQPIKIVQGLFMGPLLIFS